MKFVWRDLNKSNSLQLRNKVGDRLYAFAQGSTEPKPEGKEALHNRGMN
ncbi:hypothetical protein [Fischerella thermalis]|nr:hypothetical protein [Fischerella thermalis]